MLASKHRWFLVSGALALAAWISWASRGPESTPPGPQAPSAEEPRPAAEEAASPPPEVSTLYEQESSAYHARLFADHDGAVLVTEDGFTTFAAGKAAARRAVSLGPVVARQGGALAFWRSGALRTISLSDGHESELATLPAAPQYLLASEGRIAWIQTREPAGTILRALSGGAVRLVYETEERVSAAVLRASTVYWVAVRQDGAWSIGRVGLDGQHTATGAEHGRPPAMLALGPDGVYFYAGRDRGVRRLTFDLKQETSVLAQVICSPLVVSSRVVCAHVGGVFDIPPSSSLPRFLAAERAGPVTSVAATSERAFWVAESGEERLVVRSILLPEL
jgi:hypothetical protein